MILRFLSTMYILWLESIRAFTDYFEPVEIEEIPEDITDCELDYSHVPKNFTSLTFSSKAKLKQ